MRRLWPFAGAGSPGGSYRALERSGPSPLPANIVSALLLLVSGVYYPVRVLPGWMQVAAQFSPVTYGLEGSRDALQDGAGVAQLWESIRPLLVMGAVFVPLGLFVFHLGESYAKRTGKLKRSG